VFAFPQQRAAEIAVRTVTDWLNETPGGINRVIFNVFKDEDKVIYEQLLS
jgi:O-acetyl-ADP-ribose deacetylase (regulator of RNase III)